LFGFDETSTQASLHDVCPKGQRHWPSAQADPGAHAFPQPPQFAGSVVVSMQVPEQSTFPCGQLPVQCEATQTSPTGHCVLQAPQFDGSDAVSTQALPQRVRPLSHVHAPAVHAPPGPQLVVQAPQ
jgi:hypothetical protein